MAVEGDALWVAPLLAEAGGHRWQRVPPTERRGRMQTSTVTVAVFEVGPEATTGIDPRDVELFIAKGTGAGGQNRNKRETAVVMRHRPTGIEAKAEAQRTQRDNKRAARDALEARVSSFYASRRKELADQQRAAMVGTGMRGDKIRTYRVQDDLVTDHRTGRKARLSAVLAGNLELLK